MKHIKKSLGVLFLINCLVSGIYAQIDIRNITIARDSFGVPHIFGKTDAEVTYGLAYAHSEDDFEHLQEMLIMARDRMGEIKGRQGALSDYFTASIRAAEFVNKKYDSDLSPKFRELLESYAMGINAYAQKHPQEIKLKNLFPVSGKDIVTGYYIFLTNAVGTGQALEAIIEGRADEYVYNAYIGSNAFAFNKNSTSDGNTYLVINPHVPLEGLLSFYEAHLQSEEGWDFYGAFFPLMVSPAMGCNNRYGWATTFNWPDYIDIFKLDLNPENKNEYRFDEKWIPLESKKIKLKVKTKLKTITIKRELLWTVYGPTYRTKEGTYAIRHNNIGNIKAAEEWYMMSKAKNLTEFQQALKQHNIPMFNIMYADKEGNIAHFANGMIPERNSAYNWRKTLPGNTSSTLWDKMIPFDKMPKSINPACGYLYNTNNDPFRNSSSSCNLNALNYDPLSGWDYNRINNRDFRVQEILENKKTISLNDIKALKYDVSFPERKGGSWKNFQPVLNLDESKYPEIADAIQLMKKWNLSFDGMNTSAPIVLYTFNQLFNIKQSGYNGLETGIDYTEEELVSCIKYAKKKMIKNHKKLEVPLNAVQFISRGNKRYPVEGGPETLGASYSEEHPEGYLKVEDGDSFVMFANFGEKETVLESVVPYGASRRIGNVHYTDQMELYSNKKRKKIYLNKIDILNKAEKIYHPY